MASLYKIKTKEPDKRIPTPSHGLEFRAPICWWIGGARENKTDCPFYQETSSAFDYVFALYIRMRLNHASRILNGCLDWTGWDGYLTTTPESSLSETIDIRSSISRSKRCIWLSSTDRSRTGCFIPRPHHFRSRSRRGAVVQVSSWAFLRSLQQAIRVPDSMFLVRVRYEI